MSDEKLARIMQAGFDTLADLLRETNARIEQNGARIEANGLRIEQNGARIEANTAQIGENTAQIHGLRVELRDGLRRVEGRLDNLIHVSGGETRRLSEAMEALERRVEKLEKKAS